MVEINYMWIALLMGLFLVVSTVAVDRVRRGRRRAGRGDAGTTAIEPHAGGELPIEGTRRAWHRVDRLARRPVVWNAVFVILALGLTGAAIVLVGGFGEETGLTGTIQLGIIGLLAALLAGYLVLGTWFVVRRKGHPIAHAVGETMVVVGLLVIGIITAQLVL